MGLHPCFIDCPANRSGSAFLNSHEAMRDCSLPLDLRHYPKSHLCFTSLSQDFEFRDQQNPFVFFANWLALPSINHRNHAVLIWTGEASIASPDSTHRFLPDPYFGHGDWINVFPSKFSIAIVMFWFSWKFLFGHNNNVQILYFQRKALIFCRDFDLRPIPHNIIPLWFQRSSEPDSRPRLKTFFIQRTSISGDQHAWSLLNPAPVSLSTNLRETWGT